MKKEALSILTVIFFVLISSSVLGDITLSGIKDTYMFGESLNLNTSVSYKNEVYGFFKLSLVCTKYRSDYFLIPLLVKEGKTATISPEPIRLSKKKANINDECYILAVFLNEDQNEILSEKSDVFEVSTDFEVDVEVLQTELNPGDDLVAEISVDIPDDAFSELTIDLTLDKKLSRYNSKDKTFSLSYALPNNIKSGELIALFQIEDAYGNYVDKEIPITILQKPSLIKNLYLKDSYNAKMPGANVSFKPVLYDQSEELIDDKSINVRIFDPNSKEIVNDNVISTLRFSWQLDDGLKPGIYKIISKYEDVEEISFFSITNDAYVAPPMVENEKEAGKSDETDDSSMSTTEADNFNIWKWLAITLICLVILYSAYALGKNQSQKKKGIFKKDEFEKKEVKHKKR